MDDNDDEKTHKQTKQQKKQSFSLVGLQFYILTRK